MYVGTFLPLSHRFVCVYTHTCMLTIHNPHIHTQALAPLLSLKNGDLQLQREIF